MKRSRKLSTQYGVVIVAAGLLFSTAGCATVEKYSLTYRVWDTSELRKFSEPAQDPKLALFKPPDGHDILVQYDACVEQRPAVKRRAYYLRLNEARIATGKKPKFVNPPQSEGMTIVPVLKQDSTNANATTQPAVYAVTSNDGRQFTFHPSAGGSETHDLPVYVESSGTVLRLALTPFAVVGDAVMVAGVAAVVGIFALAESGSSFTVH